PVQKVDRTQKKPTAITNSTTPTLMPTRMAFMVALSRMPMTRITVQTRMMTTAGKLKKASCVKGSLHHCDGTWAPLPNRAIRNSLKYFDHDDATQPQAMAYSRMRSQPMIQANISPRVA